MRRGPARKRDEVRRGKATAFARRLDRLSSLSYGLRPSRGAMSFAMEKRRVSPMARAMNVAMNVVCRATESAIYREPLRGLRGIHRRRAVNGTVRPKPVAM